MIAAIVNNDEVPLNYILKNKDRVKILTSELSVGPNEEWLKIVKTTKAKRMIKEYKKVKGEVKND